MNSIKTNNGSKSWSIVKFNVGGCYFSTFLSTLEADKGENLLLQLADDPDTKKDDTNAIFIDRNPKYFDYILDYLRMLTTGKFDDYLCTLPKEYSQLLMLANEAEFYQIKSLKELIYIHMDRSFYDSHILSANDAKNLIDLCSFSPNLKWKLVYRASRDGFSSNSFHWFCDGVPNTLTICQTEDDYVCGGYTQEPWHDKGICVKGEKAFMFSLKNKDNQPLKMDCEPDHFSICCYRGYGPCFGGGHDLSIASNANLNRKSYSNLGSSYKHPKYRYCSEQAQTFLAGSYKFKVKEVEIYTKVKIDQ